MADYEVKSPYDGGEWKVTQGLEGPVQPLRDLLDACGVHEVTINGDTTWRKVKRDPMAIKALKNAGLSTSQANEAYDKLVESGVL